MRIGRFVFLSGAILALAIGAAFVFFSDSQHLLRPIGIIFIITSVFLARRFQISRAPLEAQSQTERRDRKSKNFRYVLIALIISVILFSILIYAGVWKTLVGSRIMFALAGLVLSLGAGLVVAASRTRQGE